MSEKYHFFWGGPFSQWTKSTFTIEDVTYNCAEQYMMYQKAIVHDDFESAAQILKESNPREQKALGRLVKNFDEDKWNSVAKDIVGRGSEAKFRQNHELKADLFSTYPKILVEASPYDKIWGIGLAEDDPKALNEETWEGTNWLGEILTNVRNNLMYERRLNL